MAMASFPFASNFSEPPSSKLPPYLNGDVGTDLPTDRTTRTLLFTFAAGEKKTEAVHLFSNLNQLLRTGDGTQTATLASFGINLNLGHEGIA